MRLVLTVALILINGVISAQDFWEYLPCPGYVKSGVVADSDGRIFCCSGSDGVQMSEDNGLTWQAKNNGITYGMHVDAIDINKEGFLFVNHTLGIFRSVDTGESWQLVLDGQNYLQEHDIIKCGFDSVILSGGMNYGAIVRSVDNGLTWQYVLNCGTADYYEQIQDIVYATDGVIYSCSSIYYPQIDVAAKVYKSIDYGRTWTLYWDPGLPSSFKSIEIDKEGRLLVGGGGGIFRQDNVTGLWQHIALNTIVQDIFVVSDSLIFLACDYSGGGWGGIVASINGGNTYTEIYNEGLQSLQGKGFASFIDGRLLMHNSEQLYLSSDIIISSSNSNIIDKTNVIIVYPNPIHSKCYLKSSINNPVYCHLYTAQSKQIKTLLIPAKEVEMLDLSNYPPGFYFLRYTFNDKNNFIKLLHY